jgi:hypothetical protein
MALRKPLVLVSGEIQQLQSGDDIDAPISGALEITVTNDNAGAVVIGTPVYFAAALHVDKAKADAAGTSKVAGIITTTSIASSSTGQLAVSGLVTATTGQWDIVTGGSGGLTANTDYYLDPTTAGKLTTTAPSTVGQYVVFVGRGVSTTVMDVKVARRILL